MTTSESTAITTVAADMNKTIWACLCSGDILLKRDGNEYSLPTGDAPPVGLKPWNMVTVLDMGNSCCDDSPSRLTACSSPISLRVVRLDSPAVGIPGFEMMALRASFNVLDAASYRLAGKAAELAYWDQNSKFCGCCGGPMRFETAISKRCSNCGKELWPQLATAIIVRITRGNEVLLVRARNFRRPYYGLVAGFVETGETLEEAVQREVREETGLEIDNIRYFGSQPWPYPCGLMVGFTATFLRGELHLQHSELSTGAWFTRDTLPEIPGKSSIARCLIDDWLNGMTNDE